MNIAVQICIYVKDCEVSRDHVEFFTHVAALRGLYFASQFQNIWTRVNRMSNYQESPHSSIVASWTIVHFSFSGNTMRSFCGVRVAWLKTCTDPKNSELRKPEHLQDHRLGAGDACCSFSAPGVMTGHDRTRRRVPQRCVADENPPKCGWTGAAREVSTRVMATCHVVLRFWELVLDSPRHCDHILDVRFDFRTSLGTRRAS